MMKSNGKYNSKQEKKEYHTSDASDTLKLSK